MEPKSDYDSLDTLEDPALSSDYAPTPVIRSRYRTFGRFAKAYRSHRWLLLVLCGLALLFMSYGAWALISEHRNNPETAAATSDDETVKTIVVLPGKDQVLSINAKLQVNNTTAVTGDLSVTGDVTANNITAKNISGTFTGVYTGDGSALTNISASRITSGTLSDARLSSNVTLQGNAFNRANQLVQLNAVGGLPAVDGSNLTALAAASLTGTINDARLSTNVGLLNASNTFTNTNSFTSNLNVQGTIAGDSAVFTNSVSALTLTQNGNVVCDTSGNCAGSSGVTGTGTTNTIALFTNVGTIGNSIITQSGTTITVAGTLSATAVQGDGSALTSVNAAQLNSQPASFYQNASNLTDGTVATARLPATVVYTNTANTFMANNNFTGGLQQNGNTVCDSTNNCGYITGAALNSAYVQGGNSFAATAYLGTNDNFALVLQTNGTERLRVNAGGGVTVTGNLSATNLSGDGSGITNLSATNIAAGTLGDARLSANVVLLNGTNTFTGLNNFTGGLQRNGNTVCDTSGNCNAAGPAGGDLTGTYPNPTIAKLQGIAVNVSSLTSGDMLRYNGTAWVNQAVSGDLTINSTGVATVANNAITNAKLANSSLTVTAGTGLTGGGSVSLGGSTSLAVSYGSTAGTAVEGNQTLTVNAGTNITGGGSVTLGAGGSVTVNVSSTPTFTNLTLTTALSLANGGTGATTASGARTNLGAAASGANSDITSLSAVTSVANSGSALSVGNTSQALTLQGNSSSVFTGRSGSFTTSVGFANATANVSYLFQAATAGTYDICTTAGNCVGAGGGVTSLGGTPGTLPYFSAAQVIADSLVSQSGGTVSINGALAVNSIAPTAALLLGVTSQNVTVQGAAVAITSTNGANTNTLSFATPSGSSHTITVPNAGGTVAISASGPLALDANGNLTCASCLMGGGGGAGAVDSLNSLNGPLTLQGMANQIIVSDDGVGTITLSTPQDINTSSSPTFNSATLTNNLTVTNAVSAGSLSTTGTLSVTGAATAVSFNGLTLTANAVGFSVVGGTSARTLTLAENVTLNQDLSTTSSPTFAGLTLGSALSVANGGTGATSAPAARSNLGAAASGANSDITSLTGLTTALSVGQGGTGVNGSSAANGTLLIGNGSGYTLTTLTAGSGISITNGSGSITIASTGASGSAGGDLTGTYPNPTIAKLQGTDITIASLAAGNFLQYNGTAWVNQSISGDITVNTSGVATIGAGKVTNANLVNSSVTVTAGTGLTGGGSVALGGTTTVNVQYGSTGGTAVQGDTTVTCASGTGNLAGGGDVITLGTGGTCSNLSIISNPSFTTSVTTPLLQSTNALALSASGSNIISFSTNGAEAVRIDASGNVGVGTTSTSSYKFTVNGSANATTLYQSGNQVCDNSNNCSYASSSGSGSYIQNGTALQTSANLHIQAIDNTTNGTVAAIVRGAAGGQTVNLFEAHASNGTPVATISANGSITGNDGTFAGNLGVTGTSTFTGAGSFNGGLSSTDISSSGNFTQSGAGTFSTGTGAVSLNGDVTIAGTKLLTVGTGATSLGGTLGVAGLTSLNGGLSVTGTTTLAGNVSITGASTLQTGTGSVTFGSLGAGIVQSSAGGLLSSSTVDRNSATLLTSALNISNGGTGATTAGGARTNLGAAASGANSDITSLSGLTTALSVGQGGTGATAPAGARTNLGAAASGANSDITSLTDVATIGNSTGALTIGNTNQALTLQGNASSVFTATDSGFTTTLGFANPTANVSYLFQAAAAGSYNICTTAGNCVGSGGGVTTAGGTTGTLPVFTGSQTLGDSLVSQSGSVVTIGGTLAVNTIAPTAALLLGVTSQNVTVQGAAVAITSTSGANTNTLSFASPSGASHSITLPNANGTVAVSASGPLSIDSAGNITCATCLTSGGGGSGGVSSVNTLSGALIVQGTANQIVVTDNGTNTITLSTPQDINTSSSPTFSSATLTNNLSVTNAITSGSLAVTGAATAATFNGLTLTANAGGFTVAGGTAVKTVTVTSNVTLDQDLSTTSSPSFGGLTLGTALSVANGGTGATTAGAARTNLGAAASGANSDITSLSGLTTALTVGQGGTGVNGATAANGTLLIGNGSGYSLNTLTAGTGVTITNASGGITIAANGGSGNYIQNQNASAQTTSNFWISGTGRADTSITTPLLDTATAVTLNVGTTNATAINLNQNTTIAANKTLTVTSGATRLNGGAAVAGTGTISSASTTVTGIGTAFTTQLQPGDRITASGQSATVATITSDTVLTTRSAFSPVISAGTSFTYAQPSLLVSGSTDQTGILIKAGVANPGSDAFQVQTSTGTINARIVGSTGSIYTNNNLVVGSVSTIPVASMAYFVSVFNANSALILRGAASQSADLLKLQDTSGNTNASFSATGNQLTLGRIAASGTVTQGSIVLADGTTDNFGLTLQSSVLTANRTLSFGDTDGTVFVLQATTPATAQTGNFNISGVGIAGTSLLTPLLDTASAVALNIGTTNATAINLNKNVTVAAGQYISLVGGITSTRPASPTEGMLYYDTTTKQLLTYANGKWQADRNSSTKIVAASNSSQAAKDGADYVATGTGAQTIINTALTAAAGGVVYLMEGTYTVSASISIPNNTSLTGAGSGSVITVPNAQNGTYGMIINTDSTTGTAVSVSNLKIDGNKSNQTSGNMTGVFFTTMGSGSNTAGIPGGKINNLIITNLMGVASVGINLEASAQNIASGNTISNSGYGIYLNSSPKNVISNNITQGNSYDGILINGSTRNTVSSNVSEGNAYGISLNNTAQNNTISGNNVSGNTISNLLIAANSSNNNVTANKVYNSGAASSNDGIFVTSSSNNTITGNDITDTSCTTTCYAINIFNSASDKNYLADNRFSDTDATIVSSINDAGTGTVYANQARTVDGGQLTIRTANDASALQVQSATAVPVLTVDTTNSQTILRGINSDATLGAELVTSQDFTSATYWTPNATTWTTTTTTAQHVTGNTTAITATATNITVTAGATYQVSFQLAGNTTETETVTPSIGGVTAPAIGQTGTNTHTVVITGTTTGALTFTPTTNFNGTISALSVKLITLANSALTVQNSAGTAVLEVRTSTQTGNQFIGLKAGQANTTGSLNTATGYSSLRANTTGIQNTATGYYSLYSNTTGSLNTATGTASLQANTTGTSNTATGRQSLQNNTTGSDNTANGSFSLQNNTTGSSNTASGLASLYLNTTGTNNTTGGYQSLYSNTTGSQNTASGYASLGSNTTGIDNTAIGYASLNANTTGYYNTGIGFYAGYRDPNATSFFSLENLQNSTAIGYGSQVQSSNSLVLGGQGANAVKVGIGTTLPDNTLSVSPVQYSTGTAGTGGVSSTTVTGVGTTWTSAMVGAKIIFANGAAANTPVTATITAFTNATTITVSPAITVAAGTAYRIHYQGLQVTSAGNVGIGVATPANALEINPGNGYLKVQSAGTTADLGVLQLDGGSTSRYALSVVRGATTNFSIKGNGDTTTGGTLTVTSGATSLTGASAGSAVALTVNTGAASNIGTVIKGASSQSADLLQLQNNSGNALTKFNANGDLLVGGTNSAASSNALRVNNTSGTALLNVNTSTSMTTIGDGSARTLYVNNGSNACVGINYNSCASGDTGNTQFAIQQGGTSGNAFTLRSAANSSLGGYGVLEARTNDNQVFAALGSTNMGATLALLRVSTQSAPLIKLGDVNSVTQASFDVNANYSSYGTNNSMMALAVPTFSTSSTGSAYYYVITSYNNQGETIASTSLGMANNTSALNWTAIAGANGYKIYRNTTNSFSSGSLLLTTITNGLTQAYTDTGAATSAGLPPTAPTGTKLTIQGWGRTTGIGTTNLFEVQNASGSVMASIANDGSIKLPGSWNAIGANSAYQTALTVTPSNAAYVNLVLQATLSQSVDQLQIKDDVGNILTRFDSAGRLTIGRIAASGPVVQGFVKFNDGTTSNFGLTVQSATLTANQTLTLPNETGTICTNAVGGACSATGFYIQNSTSVQTAANFYTRSAAIGSVGAAIEGANGQTADLLRLNSYNGTTSTTLARVDASGSMYFGSTTNCGTNNVTRVSAGSLSVCNLGGVSTLTITPASNSYTTINTSHGLNIANTTTLSNAPTLAVRLLTGQTADLFQGQGISGEILNKFNADGNFTSYGTNTALSALATPTLSLTTGTSGTTYYYVITATNAQGETVISNAIGTTTNTVTLGWTQVPGATGYKIYRNTSNAFTSGSLLRTTITNGTTVTYTDPGTATAAGLPPTAPTGTKISVQGWAAQSGDLMQYADSAGNVLNKIGSNGSITTYGAALNMYSAVGSANGATIQAAGASNYGSGALLLTGDGNSHGSFFTGGGQSSKVHIGVGNVADFGNYQLQVQATAANYGGVAVRSFASQTADLLSVQDSGGSTIAKIDAGGSFTTYNGIAKTVIGASGSGAGIRVLGIFADASNVANFEIGAGSGAGSFVFKGNGSNLLMLQAGGANAVAIIRTTSGQTGDLLQLQNSSGNVLSKFNTNGDLSIGSTNSTNSASALQIQNASNTSLLNFSTITNTLTVRGGNDAASLGSDLHTPVDFTNGSNWTTTGWTATTTKASHNTGNTSPLTYVGFTPTIGNKYLIMFGADTNPAGSFTAAMGGVTIGTYGTTWNRYTEAVITATSAAQLTFTPDSSYSGNIGYVRIYQINNSIKAALAVQNNSGASTLEVRSVSDAGSMFVGVNSGSSITTAFQSTAFGYQALQSDTIGSWNTAFGYKALTKNTSGEANTSIGNSSLYNNFSGSYNIALGDSTLYSNQDGAENIAIGNGALYTNTYGSQNVALGRYALDTSAASSYSTAIGYSAPTNSVSGDSNVAVGRYAGASLSTGSNSSFLGTSAGNFDSNGFTTLNNLQNASAIGYMSQVQASNSITLGGQGTNAVNVGIGTTIPLNTFSVSPVDVSAGSASQAGNTVTGSGTNWTASMVGEQFIFANGATGTITAVASITSLTLSTSQTVSSQNYRIHRIGFQVTSAGNAYVQNTSTTAFSVQSADGQALLTADTSTMTLTVKNLVITADLTVNGHLITGGSAPTISAGAAACTSPTVSVTGNDTSGIVTITTGTGCASNGTLATITFNAAFGAAPRVVLTPAGANAAGSSYYYDDSTISTSSWQLKTGSTLSSTTTYKYSYHVEQ